MCRGNEWPFSPGSLPSAPGCASGVARRPPGRLPPWRPRRPSRPGAAAATREEVGQGQGADGDRVRTEPPQFDGGADGGVAQCVLPRVAAYFGQQMGAEKQSGPAAEQDAFGTEEVDEIGDGRAQILGGVVEEGERDRVRAASVRGREGRRRQGGQCGLVVGVGGERSARLLPALAQCLRARVRLQTAAGATAAAAPPDPYDRVSSFECPAASALVGRGAMDDAGADA